MRATDLVGQEPGLDLVREWDGARWVYDGDLGLPPRATSPALDVGHLLTSFVLDGRLTTVLRDGTTFTGLGRDTARIERVASRPALDEKGHPVGVDDRWLTPGGTATLRWAGGALTSATTAHGKTIYTYATGGLSGIQTADGTGATLGPGRITTGASDWRCTRTGDTTVVEVDGARWQVTGSRRGPRSEERVIDPGGGITRTEWVDGVLAGWTDVAGRTTTLRWDEGHLTGVHDAERDWTLAWHGEALASIGGADSASLGYDAAGNLAQSADGDGALTPWNGSHGLVTDWGPSSERRSLTRDGTGAVTAINDGGRISIARDSTGRIVGVTNPAGGQWRLARDDTGRVTDVVNPAGAHWRLSWDSVGRPAALTDPTLRETRWDRDETGLVSYRVNDEAWVFGRDALRRVRTVEDPWGRRWQVAHDALGRVTELVRPDLSTFRMTRDKAGDLVAVDDFTLTRDGVGRPTAWSRGHASGTWRWSAAGWTSVQGPGITFSLTRDAAGRVSGVALDSGEAWTLDRDEVGRVTSVNGPGAVQIARDSAGRVSGLAGPAGTMRVQRDGRGLVTRIDVGDRWWVYKRDAAGRVLTLEAPAGVRLGIDRDDAGRPLLARFEDGSLAKYAWDASGVGILLQDAGDALAAVSGWTTDGLGRVTRLRGEIPTLLQRDPLGVLTVQEGAQVWSSAPDGVEGPDGASLTWDGTGRPFHGQIPVGAPPLWGVGDVQVSWVTETDGTLRAVVGQRGTVTLAHDALGRLVSWTQEAPATGAAGAQQTLIARDALGRLVSVGGLEALGWEGLMAWAGSPRASVADVGESRPGGGVVVDARGVPLLTAPGGLVGLAPSGLPLTAATGDVGVGGRFQPLVGGPLLGLDDAIDPLAGQATAAPWPIPGRERGWEAPAGSDPWPDPDSAAHPDWDPAPWASDSPFADPLALLVAVGVLPDGGPRAAHAPGLPWLPASASAHLSAPVRDPDAVDLHLDPVDAWVIAHARAPVQPPAPGDLAAFLLDLEVGGDATSGAALGSGSDPVTSTLLFAPPTYQN